MPTTISYATSSSSATTWRRPEKTTPLRTRAPYWAHDFPCNLQPRWQQRARTRRSQELTPPTRPVTGGLFLNDGFTVALNKIHLGLIAELRQKNRELQSDLSDIQARVAILEQRVGTTQQEMVDLARPMGTLSEQAHAMQAQLEAQSEQAHAMQAQMDVQSEQANATRARMEVFEEHSRRTERVNELHCDLALDQVEWVKEMLADDRAERSGQMRQLESRLVQTLHDWTAGLLERLGLRKAQHTSMLSPTSGNSGPLASPQQSHLPGLACSYPYPHVAPPSSGHSSAGFYAQPAYMHQDDPTPWHGYSQR